MRRVEVGIPEEIYEKKRKMRLNSLKASVDLSNISSRNNMNRMELGCTGEAIIDSIMEVLNVKSEYSKGWFDQDGDIVILDRICEIKTSTMNIKYGGYLISHISEKKLNELQGLFVVEVPMEFAKNIRVLFTPNPSQATIPSPYQESKCFKSSLFSVNYLVSCKKALEDLRKMTISRVNFI